MPSVVPRAAGGLCLLVISGWLACGGGGSSSVDAAADHPVLGSGDATDSCPVGGCPDASAAPLARDGASATSDLADAPLGPPADVGAPGDDAPSATFSDGAAPAAACSVCTSWGMPTESGHVTAAGLNALSGMAASWRNPGVLYVHNDHERPEFFAVSESGALIARITMSGAAVHDIEDIGVSRCPGGTCVFVADIGDNLSPRTEFSINRVVEPALTATQSGVAMTLPSEQFVFRYSDGGHNAESLVIDPTTGAIYIVTKETAGPSSVYHLETFELGRMNVASKLATLTVPAAGDKPATAGSAQPCGAGFLLRTGNTLYEFRIPPGTPFVQAFSAVPLSVPAGIEPQSEGASYASDGRSYFTTGEGNQPVIHRVTCR